MLYNLKISVRRFNFFSTFISTIFPYDYHAGVCNCLSTVQFLFLICWEMLQNVKMTIVAYIIGNGQLPAMAHSAKYIFVLNIHPGFYAVEYVFLFNITQIVLL